MNMDRNACDLGPLGAWSPAAAAERPQRRGLIGEEEEDGLPSVPATVPALWAAVAGP